jgi:glycosyltransferase involved in cell wall biosynthesis
MRVSIVIPAYNEERSIGRDLAQIHKSMEEFTEPWELVVVDDGSTDATAELAREAGAVVVSHPVNRGTGAARKTGVRHARGEIVVMTDADGTYPNEEIATLLRYFPQYDQVIGARRVERGTMRPLRWLAKTVLRLIASRLTGVRIPDPNSGFRAFKREVMARYLYLLPDGFSSVSSMTLVFLLTGRRVHFVPIDYFKRVGRSKFRPIRDTYWYLLSVLRLVAYFRPIEVFMPISLFLFGLGALKSVLDFVLLGTLQESDIILILSGLLFGALAIVADTIAMHRRIDD